VKRTRCADGLPTNGSEASSRPESVFEARPVFNRLNYEDSESRVGKKSSVKLNQMNAPTEIRGPAWLPRAIPYLSTEFGANKCGCIDSINAMKASTLSSSAQV
jgi:hypothetical protein